uniref:Uncharacterized protein n=1 Tax=Panagrolaimus superbus TaxID=310955 RepID=A0A914YM36_9BILA
MYVNTETFPSIKGTAAATAKNKKKKKMPILSKINGNESDVVSATTTKSATTKKKIPKLLKIEINDTDAAPDAGNDVNENMPESQTSIKNVVKRKYNKKRTLTKINGNGNKDASASIKNATTKKKIPKLPNIQVCEDETDVEIKLQNTNPNLPFEDMRMYDGHMNKLSQGEQRYGMIFFV